MLSHLEDKSLLNTTVLNCEEYRSCVLRHQCTVDLGFGLWTFCFIYFLLFGIMKYDQPTPVWGGWIFRTLHIDLCLCKLFLMRNISMVLILYLSFLSIWSLYISMRCVEWLVDIWKRERRWCYGWLVKIISRCSGYCLICIMKMAFECFGYLFVEIVSVFLTVN